jgi:hypothetical protein
MKSTIAVSGLVVIVVSHPLRTFAQQCPPELAQAKSKIASAESMDIKAPRTLVGERRSESDHGFPAVCPRRSPASSL